MGFIERELERVSKALLSEKSEELRRQMYVAQQALSWALEPQGFAAPYDVIDNGLVVPFTGTQEG